MAGAENFHFPLQTEPCAPSVFSLAGWFFPIRSRWTLEVERWTFPPTLASPHLPVPQSLRLLRGLLPGSRGSRFSPGPGRG